MRISTQMIFDQGVAGIQRQNSALFRTQQQVATGRRVVTPADDPLAAAQALQYTQADEMNTQFRVNRDFARSRLTLTESTLAAAGDILQEIRESVVAAGNAINTDAELKSFAVNVTGQLQQFLGLANATDAEGQYVFSGFQSNTQPFSNAPGGVQYLGDDGLRELQVAPSRQIATNVSGAEAFMRVRNGNGTFSWAPGALNTGSGIIGPGAVTNPALLTGDNYQIVFTVAAGVTTYDVIDTTTATTILTAQPYVQSSATIGFDGISVNIQNDPANGDTFTVSPSVDQSIFQTVQNMIGVLRSANLVTVPGRTALADGLGQALTNLDQGIESLLKHRVIAGTNLRELDALDSAGESLGLQFQEARSNLVDLDYAKALSDLTREQISLEAAQKSFARIATLSLFDFI